MDLILFLLKINIKHKFVLKIYIENNNAPLLFALKYSILDKYQSIMPDDPRCGLDASSLHRDTSMYNYNDKKFSLLSCHRYTSNIARNKVKQKLRILKLSAKIFIQFQRQLVCYPSITCVIILLLYKS